MSSFQSKTVRCAKKQEYVTHTQFPLRERAEETDSKQAQMLDVVNISKQLYK